jgi:hypothetical protein
MVSALQPIDPVDPSIEIFFMENNPNPNKPEIRNSPDLIKLAEIRNKFESPKFK